MADTGPSTPTRRRQPPCSMFNLASLSSRTASRKSRIPTEVHIKRTRPCTQSTQFIGKASDSDGTGDKQVDNGKKDPRLSQIYRLLLRTSIDTKVLDEMHNNRSGLQTLIQPCKSKKDIHYKAKTVRERSNRGPLMTDAPRTGIGPVVQVLRAVQPTHW